LPSDSRPSDQDASGAASNAEREFDRLLSIASTLQAFRNLQSTGWMPDANGKTVSSPAPANANGKKHPG
jgi:hypothetical protein